LQINQLRSFFLNQFRLSKKKVRHKETSIIYNEAYEKNRYREYFLALHFLICDQNERAQNPKKKEERYNWIN
jgi:hypothetical protein